MPNKTNISMAQKQMKSSLLRKEKYGKNPKNIFGTEEG